MSRTQSFFDALHDLQNNTSDDSSYNAKKSKNESSDKDVQNNTNNILLTSVNNHLKKSKIDDDDDEDDDDFLFRYPPTLNGKKSSNVSQSFYIPPPPGFPEKPVKKNQATVRVFWNLHALPIPGDIGLLNTMKRIVNSSPEIANATSITFRLYEPIPKNHGLYRTVGPPCYPTILRYCETKKNCDNADKFITTDALNFAFAYVVFENITL